MMRKFFTNMTFMSALIVAVWTNTALATDTNDPIPMALVKDITNKVLEVLKKEKGPQNNDTWKLIDQIMSPHFDFRRISKNVLRVRGKNWLDIMNDSQFKRFTKEFRDMLVRTYATALLKVSGDKVEVDYLPMRTEKDDKKATVQTIVKYRDERVSIDYKIDFNPKENKWQIYDLIIGGVILVTNYRAEFNASIQKIGAEALIQKIADSNEKAGQGQK